MKTRGWLFLPLGAAFFALFFSAMRDLPPVSQYRGPYGYVLNSVCVYQRHATDVVTAINFDYRGFDTVGEEFILFTSVMGVALLLRKQKDEKSRQPRDHARERAIPPINDAVRVLGLGLVGAMVAFGVYVVTHGQLTPGGGFQGGVILASIPLMVYLIANVETILAIAPQELVEVGEALGAAAFVCLGLLGMFFGAPFLTNVLPLGQTGSVISAGTIPLISLTTGLEVAAGFILLQIVFLDKVLLRRWRGPQGWEGPE